MQLEIEPHNGMTITQDTRLKKGVYYLPDGIVISKDHVVLDGNGAWLIGDLQGKGIAINQKSGVTIKNVNVARYYHGIWVNASANVCIENSSVTQTHEIVGNDVFLDVWLDRNQAYGGGIFLCGVIDSRVQNNNVQHQQNGVMLYGCNKVTITENNASFNSGAGILMYESSENEVAHNIADYCCRIYSYRERDGKMSYHNGADAAAVVMMCNSSRNVVSHNMLRSGGDGVFLGGFHKDEIKTPCNENVFEHNDGSFSPNIAFEATFSERNVFRHNRADNCNFGFWLGYSSHTTVEDNSISGNRIAGVAIEHGHHNHIQKNKLVRNRAGMKFWVGANPVFTSFFPQHAESYATEIHQNELTRNELGIHIYTESGTSDVRCHSFHIQNNTLNDNRIAIQLERARQCDILNNLIKQNVEMGIKMVGCKDMNIHSNEM